MPVDLSKIGLEGLESYQSRMESASRTTYNEALANKTNVEVAAAERQQALADEASAALNDIAMGKKRTSGVDPGSVETMSGADVLETTAQVFARGGAPETAMEMFSKAAEIRKKENDIDNDKVLAEQRRLENIIKGADVVGRYLGKARNQSEWNFGIKKLQEQGIMEPELIQQLAQMPFDEDVAAYFADQAISNSDQAKLDMDKLTQDRLQRQGDIEATQAQQRITLQAARDAETRRHNLQIEKASGNKSGGAAAPNKAEVDSAGAALRSAGVFKGLVAGEEGEDFNTAADYIASNAKALIQTNKSLDWQTAVQRSILMAQTQGMFSTTEGEGKLLGIFGSETPPKAKFEGPLPMPKTKAEMQPGKIYITSRGRAKWNGSVFEPVE